MAPVFEWRSCSQSTDRAMACYCGSAEPGEMPEIEGVENKMKLLDLDLGVISLVMHLLCICAVSPPPASFLYM